MHRLHELRVESLSQEDRQQWYRGTAAEDGGSVLSPQNEAAALTKLLESSSGSKSQGHAGSPAQQEVQQLCNTYLQRTRPWPPSSQQDPTSYNSPAGGADRPQARAPQGVPPQQADDGVTQGPQSGQSQLFPEDSPETRLMRWGQSQGIITSLVPAVFRSPRPTSPSCVDRAAGQMDRTSSSSRSAQEDVDQSVGGVRGMMAPREISAGHTLISVPRSCLITYETALNSDFGACLRRIPGLDEQSAAVLWTMVDRHDPESPHAAFWGALPRCFGTGLGVCGRVLEQGLAGCGDVLREAREARKHIKQQYQSLSGVISALLRAYGQFIQPEHLSWQSYLWAVQLWYAYAIQVQLPDGSLQPCLVPVVSLLNHSPWPHSVAFSRLDPKTQRLNVKCFRSVQSGEQVYLSYGALPNAHLTQFYGFAVEDNPYDTVELRLEAHAPGSAGDQAVTQDSQGITGRQVRVVDKLLEVAGLSLRHEVRGWGGLPSRLMATARLLCADDSRLQELWVSCQKPAGGKSKGKGKKAQSGTGDDENERMRSSVLRVLEAERGLGAEVEQLAVQLVVNSVVRAGRERVCGQLGAGVSCDGLLQFQELFGTQSGGGGGEGGGDGAGQPTSGVAGEGGRQDEESDWEEDGDRVGEVGFGEAARTCVLGQLRVLVHVQHVLKSIVQERE